MVTEELKENPEKSLEEITREKVLVGLNMIKPGIEWKKEFIDRLILLELNSKINRDSRMVEAGLVSVLNEMALRRLGKITDEHLSETRVAARIHDVGKSGPPEADKEQQLAVTQLFATEKLKREHKDIKVEKAVREIVFKGNEYGANLMLARLMTCGVDISMPMQSFWESHARWGAEIIKKDCGELSENTKLIAILHHVDKGPEFNFSDTLIEEIDEEVLQGALTIGQLEDYVDAFRQRAIIAVDQYDAYIHRSGMTHELAIATLKKKIEGSKTFSKDALLRFIIQVMEDMGKEKIFDDMVKQL